MAADGLSSAFGSMGCSGSKASTKPQFTVRDAEDKAASSIQAASRAHKEAKDVKEKDAAAAEIQGSAAAYLAAKRQKSAAAAPADAPLGLDLGKALGGTIDAAKEVVAQVSSRIFGPTAGAPAADPPKILSTTTEEVTQSV